MVRIRGILPSNCCGDGSILIQTSPSARGSSWKLIGVKKKAAGNILLNLDVFHMNGG